MILDEGSAAGNEGTLKGVNGLPLLQIGDEGDYTNTLRLSAFD